MIEINIQEKTIGSKLLFRDLSVRLAKDEKVAVIGRNGVGKSTLFGMIAASDHEYLGKISYPRGTEIILTDQEHLPGAHTSESVLAYLLRTNRRYQTLTRIIEEFGTRDTTDMALIQDYSEAVQQFNDYGFYQLEDNLVGALGKYQISLEQALGPFAALSGGQKRFVQLVQVEFSHADLLLIDEPTNHMDYVAKEAFISWLRAVKHQTVVIITHDRDVLREVDRIIELKDLRAASFPGNYDSYLKQNSAQTANQMSQFEVGARRIEKLKQQIAYARTKKSGWSGTADKKNPFVVMETRLTKELKELQAVAKPSFWIDQESVEAAAPKVVERYERYKDRNINISLDDAGQAIELLEVEKLSLGYDGPLFKDISFTLAAGEKLQLVGRNGAGKSTLVNAVRAMFAGDKLSSKVYGGHISCGPKLRLGYYEQEIGADYIDTPLIEAVEAAYAAAKQSISHTHAMQLLAQYLFDPAIDGRIPLRRLSGGQRARFQLIRMLAAAPNLLILDEPTNHLDLPSIEELETALKDYTGAVLYISHDSYFASNVGGVRLQIGQP